MSNTVVSVDQLANEIARAMQEYTSDVTEAVTEAVDDTAKEAIAEVRKRSPRMTGEYAKGWKRRRRTSSGQVEHVIYQDVKPGLVHLLEKGHAKAGGGRVAAHEHLAPVAEEFGGKLSAALSLIVKRGGR